MLEAFLACGRRYCLAVGISETGWVTAYNKRLTGCTSWPMLQQRQGIPEWYTPYTYTYIYLPQLFYLSVSKNPVTFKSWNWPLDQIPLRWLQSQSSVASKNEKQSPSQYWGARYYSLTGSTLSISERAHSAGAYIIRPTLQMVISSILWELWLKETVNLYLSPSTRWSVHNKPNCTWKNVATPQKANQNNSIPAFSSSWERTHQVWI